MTPARRKELDAQLEARLLASLDPILEQMTPEAVTKALVAPDLSGFLVAIATGLPVWPRKKQQRDNVHFDEHEPQEAPQGA